MDITTTVSQLDSDDLFLLPLERPSNLTSYNSTGDENTFQRSERSDHILQDISDILTTEIAAGICIFGILGNILTLIILTRRTTQKNMPNMERSSQEGLIALSVSDILFCIVALPEAILKYIEEPPFYPLYLEKDFDIFYTMYMDFIVNVFVTSSTLLTVMLAMQRYLAICHPIKTRIRTNYKHTRVFIVSIFILSFILNLPRLWKRKFTVVECMYSIIKANCTDISYLYSTRRGYLQEDRAAKTAFMVVHFILSVIIPLFVLSFCNVKLTQALRKSNRLRKRHSYASVTSKLSTNTTCIDHTQRITLTLIVIIIMFILLVTPAEITNFVREFKPELRTHQPLHTNSFITAIVNTLQKVNFAFNFILYCVVNQNFRKTLWNVMVGRALQHFSSSAQKLHRSSLKSEVKFHSMDLQPTMLKEDEAEFRQLKVIKKSQHQSVHNFMCI